MNEREFTASERLKCISQLDACGYALDQIKELLQIAITKRLSETEADTILKVSFDKVCRVIEQTHLTLERLNGVGNDSI